MVRSQSPLVGAFVPARQYWHQWENGASRNPLWSGHSFRLKHIIHYFLILKSRNPLWSGHSFRRSTVRHSYG